MIWDCERLITSSNPVILPCSFTAQLLAIDIAAGNQKDTWYKAGFLQSFVEIEGIKFVGNRSKLIFGSQLIEVPYRTYQLQYDPADWLQNISIKIKELSITQLKTIIMSGSYDPGNRPVGADSSVTVAAAITNTVLAVANANRSPEGFIVNNSNKNLWVTFTGVAATAAAPATKVLPNGGNYDIPGGYTGAINGIWEAGATGSCVIHEFSYI
jgi:hypothetical protein